MNQDTDEAARMQQRARNVFARAARMQDLHAQAQATARAGGTHGLQGPLALAGGDAGLAAERTLSLSASLALGNTHLALLQAAQAATLAASTDPELQRLDALLNGSAHPPTTAPATQADVVDVLATVLPDPAPPPAAPPTTHPG